MKTRLVLTVTWMLSMLISLLGIALYVLREEPNGEHFLAIEDLPDVIRNVCIFYSSYLGGILTFWYFRPFQPHGYETIERARFAIALAGTVIINIIVIAFCWLDHVTGYQATESIFETVNIGLKLAGYMSFLVAPANLYYFGIKPCPTPVD